MRPEIAPAITGGIALLALVLGLRHDPAPVLRRVLAADAAAYRSVCSQCHPPFPPRTYPKTRWRSVVEEMLARADHRGIEIAPDDLKLLIGYLEIHGR